MCHTTMDLKFVLFLILFWTNVSDCSQMKLKQVIKFDLFSLYNSTLSPYLTSFSVGTPPQTLNLLVDTGSDLTWIDCSNVGFNTFNASESSTASIIYCPEGMACEFKVAYEDGTLSSGYMVSDLVHFTAYAADSPQLQLSSRIIFGCSTFKTVNSKIHGIIGLGRSKESLISQLFAQQISPKVISHCLASNGGGFLLLGEVVEKGFTYSPLIPSEDKYLVSLDSLTVNGTRIDASNSSGINRTVVDSGTTLTYLAARIYDPLVDAVSAVLNKSTVPLYARACYEVPSIDNFPQITINFVNGALILLMPEEYVQFDGFWWCLGFRRAESVTILGDLVLRGKIVVYDQTVERFGLLSRDCSQPVNVSLNYHQEGTSGSSSNKGNNNMESCCNPTALCWSNILMLFAFFLSL